MSYGKRRVSLGTFASTSPDGYLCGYVRDFVVIAQSADPYTIQWSALGDPTSWPTPGSDAARTAQAGEQTFPSDFGIVTGIAGNDFFGYVFQERAVTKMGYVGGDVVFTFDTFEENRGVYDIGRFVQTDDTVFYQSEFGYHALTDGRIQDIGLAKVDDSYLPTRTNTFTGSNGTNFEPVLINKNINCVFFQNNYLCYNYKTDQWSRVPVYDGLNLYSLDSHNGVIGQVIISGSAADFQTSEGAPAATATATTGEVQLTPGQRSLIDGIRPLTNGASITSVRVGVRDLLSDSVTWATGSSINTRTGMTNFRGGDNTPEGRYHRAEFVFSGGFVTLYGADIEYYDEGEV